MELKKNPQADLSRRTGLFFAIGLAVATSISLFAINFKSYESDRDKVEFSAVDDNLDEEVEEIVMENTPPPQPPPEVSVPEQIEVVDNKVEIKTDFASTETTKNEVIAEAPKIETPVEDDIPDEIPFAVIEDKPTFEVCKNLPKGKQQEDCFKKTLDSHVQKHFRYPEIAQEMQIQGRVTVLFRINKDGSVTVTGVRGPDKALEAEARRIIEKLPNFIPGKQRGKPVAVTYAYPIMFKLNN
ncbi:energy transducer TonB [Capnocytophaga catalasegens]|uniref:Protein TonB n=1 Tax=Capnocytophaga catalasegens TaxID=1004260 RepID=A0AAV5AUV4_9FLAO|nr:energy transducer TonB [Capnocytophaga catalasegens]GIZ14904.1 protein TonB [Capnocytophaga catalasegens]GJM49283.1 protein TonB [Capnocytophaga catalasegens]GJM52434.1 protein TonB [Capnocytophaga catalasegens]